MKQTICQDNLIPTPTTSCIPAILTFTSDLGAPVDVFSRLSTDEKHAFLFESVEGDGRLARYSFLGFDPLLTVIFKDQSAIIDYRDQTQTIKQTIDNPVKFLQELLSQYLKQLEQIKRQANAEELHAIEEFAKQVKDLPFAAGLAGYMGYNASSYLDKIPQQKKDILGVPEGYYGLYDGAIVFDHQYKRIHILSLRGQEHANSVLTKILQKNQIKPLQLNNTALDEKQIFNQSTASFSKEEYVQTLLRTKEFIKQGEAFQIALSQRFSINCQANTLNVYRLLQATNPSPYAYYLKYPEFVYLGSSPETFLQCRNGQLLLRAIAGTRRRGTNAQEDESLAKELRNDEKEMAEHRMLVDLGRNDLGRVCRLALSDQKN